MVQKELTDDTAWPKSWAGGKINQPGKLAPYPSDKNEKNGTLLCDVTMTLIRQEKIWNIFLLEQHICFL